MVQSKDPTHESPDTSAGHGLSPRGRKPTVQERNRRWVSDNPFGTSVILAVICAGFFTLFAGLWPVVGAGFGALGGVLLSHGSAPGAERRKWRHWPAWQKVSLAVMVGLVATLWLLF